MTPPVYGVECVTAAGDASAGGGRRPVFCASEASLLTSSEVGLRAARAKKDKEKALRSAQADALRGRELSTAALDANVNVTRLPCAACGAVLAVGLQTVSHYTDNHDELATAPLKSAVDAVRVEYFDDDERAFAFVEAAAGACNAYYARRQFREPVRLEDGTAVLRTTMMCGHRVPLSDAAKHVAAAAATPQPSRTEPMFSADETHSKGQRQGKAAAGATQHTRRGVCFTCPSVAVVEERIPDGEGDAGAPVWPAPVRVRLVAVHRGHGVAPLDARRARDPRRRARVAELFDTYDDPDIAHAEYEARHPSDPLTRARFMRLWNSVMAEPAGAARAPCFLNFLRLAESNPEAFERYAQAIKFPGEELRFPVPGSTRVVPAGDAFAIFFSENSARFFCRAGGTVGARENSEPSSLPDGPALIELFP